MKTAGNAGRENSYNLHVSARHQQTMPEDIAVDIYFAFSERISSGSFFKAAHWRNVC